MAKRKMISVGMGSLLVGSVIEQPWDSVHTHEYSKQQRCWIARLAAADGSPSAPQNTIPKMKHATRRI